MLPLDDTNTLPACTVELPFTVAAVTPLGRDIPLLFITALVDPEISKSILVVPSTVIGYPESIHNPLVALVS